MTRNRASAKKAGTAFATSIANHLAANVSDLIERRTLTGAVDRGDISGLRHMGGRIAVECKDHGGRYLVGGWLDEAATERGNDDALVGLVVAKRRGITYPGDQVVFMCLDDFVALLTGSRPEPLAP